MKPLNLPKNLKKPYQATASKIFLNKLLQRKRNVRSSRTFARKYFKKVSLLVIFALSAALIFFTYTYVDEQGYLDIKGFEVTGVVRFVNPTDASNLIRTNLEGKKIFNFDGEKLEALLKSNFLGAKNISVQRVMWNKVKVVIDERVPLAVLFSLVDGKKYLIDADGYVLGEVEGGFNELPVVQYDRGVQTGSFVEKNIAPLTLELLGLSEKEQLNVTKISFYPKYMKLSVENGTEVLIGNSKDYAEVMEILSSLLKRASLEGKRIKGIDLRYDKVIVSYD